MKSLIVKSTAVLLIIGGSLFTFSEEIFAAKNKCCSIYLACCVCDGPCSAGLFICECTGGSASTN